MKGGGVFLIAWGGVRQGEGVKGMVSVIKFSEELGAQHVYMGI